MKRLPLMRTAWRNVWRNKRRSAITIAALAVAAGSTVWFMGWGDGFTEKMAEDTVKSGMGHVVVEPKGFEKDPQISEYIDDPAPVVSLIEGTDGVETWAPRVEARGLATTPENSMGAVVFGVDPARERRASVFPNRIVEGSFFGYGDEEGVIIGHKMADVLGVELGDPVGVMVQSLDGEVRAEAYELVGIIRTGNPMFDNGFVILPIAAAQELIGYGSGYNKIAIIAESAGDASKIRDAINDRLPPDDLEALTWYEVSPQAYQFYQMMLVFMGFMLILLIVLASFGVTNTILMSVLERVHEFGVMAAVGLRPFQVFRLIFYEASVLSFIGVVVGLIAGGILTWINSIYGVDLGFWASGVQMTGLLDPVIFFALKPYAFVVTGIAVFFIGVVSSIYPGIKAARFRPVEAMRHV
ncbi:MAG: ABC transporter permease [Candidatus Coatesbacteria bacterium]|nr:MAG: ABC transporter permease [Candidatus Coatesbacteria bacterium]